MAQKPGILVKSSNKSIAVGKGVGVYTDIFQIYKDITYTLSFKCLNLNSTTEFNYLRLFTSNNVQILDSAKLDNTTGLVVGDREEYFVKLTFKSTLEGKARLLIGREYVEEDLIDTPLFFIREVQLQKGSYVTEFDDKSALISKFKSLESQFNMLSTDINMRVSRQEFDSKYNPILDEVSSIDIKSGKIELKVTEYVGMVENYQKEVDSYKKLSTESIANLQDQINNIDPSLDESFRDGIIDEAEYIAIKQKISLLDVEKKDLDRVYNNLITNENLKDNFKTNLESCYNAYTEAHNNLVSYINESIGDRIGTPEEKAQIEVLLDLYSTALSNYSVAQTEAINSISDANSESLVNSLREELQGNIKDVSDRAGALEDAMRNFSVDGILDEVEKESIRNMLNILASEKTDIDSEYIVVYSNPDLVGAYKVNLKTAYDTYIESYNSLVDTINEILLKTILEESDSVLLNTKFSNHDSALSTYSTKVSEALDSIILKRKDDALLSAKEYANSQISIEKDNILSTVSQKYTTTSQVEIISVSWMNRAFGTSESKSNTFQAGTTWIAYYIANDVSGKEMTISFDYSHNFTFTDTSHFYFRPRYLSSDGTYLYKPNYELTNDMKANNQGHISFKVTFPTLLEGELTNVRFYAVDMSGDFTISNVMVNEGAKETAWREAPEDSKSYAETLAAGLQEQIDGKIQTWYQNTDPSLEWTTAEDKNKHIGDIWYNGDTKETKRWTGTGWDILKDKEAQDASDLAKKKAQIFIKTPTVPYYVGDLWVTSTAEKSGTMKTCINERTSGSYTASDWIENLKYTDDTLANKIQNDLNNLTIGVRNLALKTSNEYTNPYSTFDGGTNKCVSSHVILTDGLRVGDNMTIRCIFKYTDIVAAEGNTATVYIQGNGDVTQWNPGLTPSPKKTLSNSGEIEIKYSFTLSENQLKNSKFNAQFRFDYVQSGSIQWKLFKAEKGNKDTDWTPAPEDTETYVDNLVSDLQEQIDNKIQTYNQTTDPSSEWTTTEEKNKHKGDIWYNDYSKETKRWSGTSWSLLENKEAQEAATLAKTKAQIFIDIPTIPYYAGDLWITSTEKGKGVVKTCIVQRTEGSFRDSDWVENLKYTDDTLANKLQSDLNNLTIGGRNLLIGSDNNYLSNLEIYSKTDVTYSSDDGWRKMTITTQCTNNEIVQDKWVTPTKTGYYTFSILCKTDATSISTKVSWFTHDTGHNTQNATVTSVGNGIYKIVSTYNLTNLNRIRVVDLQNFNTVGASYISFRYPKLEYGNKATDWTPAPEDTESYTDDLVYDLQTQIDNKIQSYNQNTDPSVDWTTNDEKKKHVGDLWYNPDTSKTKRYNESYTWELQPEAETLAKTKSAIWSSKPSVPYYKNDLWILESDSIHTAGKKGEILTCGKTRTTGSYTSSDWSKGISYTDDTYAKTVESNINQRADSIELSVNKLEENSAVIKIDNYFAMKASNWGHDTNASATDYEYQGKKYVIVKALAEENNNEQYAWIICKCKANTRYTVRFNYSPIDPARDDIRIVIETNGGNGWDFNFASHLKIPTTNTWETPEVYEKTFFTNEAATEISISIGHASGENCWVYVSNFSIVQGSATFQTNANFRVLSDKIESKVSSGELSSLISQDAESVRVAFNNIAKNVVTLTKDGLTMDGMIKSKLDSDRYAKFYPQISGQGDIQFVMYLSGDTIESDFLIINRYLVNGIAVEKNSASFGRGGSTFFNNVTFNTDQTGTYNGKCYWENGTYYPEKDNTNLIGLQTNKFNGVYTTWIGSEPGLLTSNQLVVSGRTLQLRSNFSHSYIQADESGYFRPTSTDSSNTWALGSPSYKFSALYANTINNSSDIRLKENIQYLRRSNDTSTMAAQSLLNEKVFYDISIQDLYEFVKNDLMLVKYRFKTSKEREELQNDLFGFIAQDIKDTSVGSVLIEEFEDSTLSYDLSSYVSILAGALQESIIREEEHQEKTVELEKQIEDLKLKNLELEKRISELEQLILSKE